MNVSNPNPTNGIAKIRLVLLLILIAGSIIVSIDLASFYLPLDNPNYPVQFAFRVYYAGSWTGSYAGWSGNTLIENHIINGKGTQSMIVSLVGNPNLGITFSITARKLDNSTSQLSLFLSPNFANTTQPFGEVHLQETMIS